MRWKVGKYLFEAQTNVLLGPGGKKLLEPKASALLTYFLENQRRDISRDELIQSVWDGQIVTDGAINRVVVQLRRELDDTARIKRVIVTVPKVGYRFVHPAQKVAQQQTHNRRHFHRVLAVLFGSAAMAIGFWLWPTNTEPPVQNPNITPMVRLASAQYDAAYTAQSGQLVYVQRETNGAALYLAAQADAPAVQIGPTTGRVDSPTWSPGGDLLVFRHIDGHVCTFRVLTFIAGVPPSDQTVYSCKPYGNVSFAFDSTATRLYFTEQTSPYDKQQLYELELESRLTSRPSQPSAKGIGNHHLDLHPTKNWLLVLHDRAPGLSSAYVLDIADNTYQKLIDWPFQVEYAVWGHRPGTIVHPGEHPSYRLLETEYETGNARILVSDSRRIKEPMRIDNGRDYLFTSYIINQDIYVSGHDSSGINSSVMDYLATLSTDGTQLAFISKRTGTSLIWIRNLETGQLRSINSNTAGKKLRAMQWSPSNDLLLVTTNTGLIVANSFDGTVLRTIDAPHTVFGASWVSNDDFVYSYNTNGRWQLFRHSIDHNQTVAENNRWAFKLENEFREISIDQELKVFEQDAEILAGTCASILRLQDITLRLDGKHLYCISKENSNDLIRMDAAGQVARIPDAVSSTRHFSVAEGLIARTDITNIVSDIMRTQYDPEARQ